MQTAPLNYLSNKQYKTKDTIMKMKNKIITTCLTAAGLLAIATFVSVEQKAFAQAPPDTAHAAHVAAAASQPDGQTLDAQLAELRAKVQQLEAIIQQTSGSSPLAHSAGAGAGTIPPAGPMAGAVSPGMSAMPGMGAGAKPMPGGMGAMSSPPGGAMNMMGMMDKMMGMMDKMMSMGGGAMPAGGAPMSPAASGGMGGGGMGMGMMQSEMGGMGGGAMSAGAPAAGMSGGGMGMMAMDKMEMAGMMGMMGGMGGKGGSSMAMSSALPGFPGASHLYHIGSTGFFLDHPQHITLSTEQQMALNQIKERAALDKSSADRQVQEAEQQLWKLTAADQPDAPQIETKVREVEKLRGDERLGFIRAVGEAAKVLSEEQRMALVGTAASATSAATTGAPAHQHKP